MDQMNNAETTPPDRTQTGVRDEQDRLGHGKELRLKRRDKKRRMGSEEDLAYIGGCGRRGDHRYQSSCTDFVQDNLDREQHSANWRVKCCSNTAARACSDKGNPLPGGQVQNLGDGRTEGGTNLYDRPLAANRPSTADRDAGSNRFDDRYHRANHTPPVIDRIHDLRNPMPLCFWGEVLDQKRYPYCTDDRHENDKYAPWTRRRMNVRVVGRGKLPEK